MHDTIAAIATPPGMGGVGIVRISGTEAPTIAAALSGPLPPPRHAAYRRFRDADGQIIDEGILLYFPAPGSFTGEEVVELQGHGGPVVMDLLLQAALRAGARLARPGEFSERAFLNDKLDLVQAEAIADLIEAGTAAAARSASRSLQGLFSDRVHGLVEQVIHLRMYVEAAIDFPEEEIDFLSDGRVATDMAAIREAFEDIQRSAGQGQLLRDGMRLVLAGLPNAGKSSLMNALAGRETAIVTEIPGTTRDLLREQIQIDGMPLHLVDTAGLRRTDDPVEKEGVRRAQAELAEADLILWLYDAAADPEHRGFDAELLPPGAPLCFVRNKIDVAGEPAGRREIEGVIEIALSAKQGEGMDLLRAELKERMGYQGNHEGEFIARRRHLRALEQAADCLQAAERALHEQLAGELVAEDLRRMQNHLSEITGEFTPDDLLGEIFSSFCIGK